MGLTEDIRQNPGFIYFNLNTDQLRENWRDVSKADLRIHLPRAPTSEDIHAKVTLNYVSLNYETGNYEIIKARTTTVKLKQDHGGWVDMKVWEVVMLWLKNPSENLGLLVQVSTNTNDDLHIFHDDSPVYLLFFFENISLYSIIL